MSNAFLQRRQFLGWTGLAATCTVLGLSTSLLGGTKKKKRKKGKRAKKSQMMQTPSAVDLSEEHFEDLVGDEFEISNLRDHIKLKLLEVREHDHHTDAVNRPSHVRMEPFSLLFIAPNGEVVESGIYELEHPELGDVDLFLHEVGVDQDVDTVHYEVIFN